MEKKLPIPTIELIHSAVSSFKSDPNAGLTDRAIQLLVTQFPSNTSVDAILLKVTAINSLYSTNMYAVVAMAEHIAGLGIDTDLRVGSHDVVERIATVWIGGKKRRNYSFASKYCSWHNPDLFPIFDSQVDNSLWAYRKQDQFSEFRRSDLQIYAKFTRVIADFKEFYGLGSVNYKQLDNFLWQSGRQLMEPRLRSQ
ncbi:MAG: hypothetical protein HYX26_00265 [Acidobacteriales bacterium]|nr:hypothetical protein [Terriglobales bacterium]